jgi:outer membrane lipoprotein LolB
VIPGRSVIALAALAILALTGCAPAPTRPPVADAEAAWAQHRAILAKVSAWRLNGNLAVEARGDGGQGRVDWRQRDDVFDIRLSGPLGSGTVRLNGDREGATLTVNGERLRDADPSWLLYQQTGWWIPVESLRWWALGLPAPDMPAAWVLDDQGRLARLEQNGWTIRFDGYRAERGGVQVPGRLMASAEDAEVRLVVRRWELLPERVATHHGG